MLVDALVIGACLFISTSIRPSLNNISFIKIIPNDVGVPLPLYGMFSLITLIIFSAFALYDGKKLLRAADEFSTLTFAFLILSIALAGVLYLSYRDVSRALFILFLFLAYSGLLIWRSLARIYFRFRKQQENIATRRMLILGAGDLGQKVYKNITTHAVENLCIVGYLDNETLESIDGVNILGKIEDCRQIVNDYNVTDVILALPHSIYQNFSLIISMIEDMPLRIWVALGFYDLALYRMGIADVAGIPMLDLRAPTLSEYQLQIKRAFDLVFGSLALILFSPLMVLTAMIIWLQDHGPIIFKQQRVGENGRIFTIYKFRTMVQKVEQYINFDSSAEENKTVIPKTPNDPRITSIGRFLRRTSIDELPQLFNVLEGTMSLVGPRPELPYLVEKYQIWQRKRLTVPPGMTGWWQVTGRSEKPLYLNTEDDLYYVQNYSIWLDLRILIRTIWVVLIGKGSF